MKGASVVRIRDAAVGKTSRRRDRTEHSVRTAITDLHEDVISKFQRISAMCAGPLDPRDGTALPSTLELWAGSIGRLRAYRGLGSMTPGRAIAELQEIEEQASVALGQLPTDAFTTREALNWLVGRVIATQAQLARLLTDAMSGTASDEAQHTNRDATITEPRIVIQTDLLYQVHHSLFPAERMFVVGGRRDGSVTTLGAGWDVTGSFTGASVRADPARLGRALIAMDLSGSYLAAWMHSHPGSGADCTHPSHIDLDQQEDWTRDYTNDLLSAIFVEDRWIRFWGPAVEMNRVKLELQGPGVVREEQDDNLYRLTD